MVAIVTVASGYPYLQAKLSLLFSGTLVFFLALVQLARELKHKKHRTNEKGVEHKKLGHDASVVQYGLEFSWMVGFGLTIYLLGFIVAIPVFVCAYMKSHEVRWRASIITGMLISAFCYVVFVLVLEREMYPGKIFICLGLW